MFGKNLQKSATLNLIPGTLVKLETENQLYRVVLCPPQVHYGGLYVSTYMHPKIYKLKKLNTIFLLRVLFLE